MKIESDRITYEVTRRYEVSDVDPVPQWDNTTAPGPMLTPCDVRVVWTWAITDSEPATPHVTVYGYRTRKDGTRADMPISEIFSLGSRYNTATMPNWLRELAEDRPAVVTTYGA
jgi:hypothetical protein